MEALLVAASLLLAFANGANDNPKGVATLWGAGSLSYRGAVALATVSTALGSLCCLLLAGALLHVFTGKGLVPEAALDARFGVAVTSGASVAVLLATRLGAPVSTTHALLGGFLGAGLLAAGSELRLGALAGSFVLPLALGPVLGGVLALLLSRGVVGDERAPRVIRAPVLRDAGHLVSACLVGFARGLNDTPKIVGLVAGLAGVPVLAGVLAVTAAMAAGGLLAARRVAETLAHRLTPMTPAQGLVGNLATSLLVVGASQLGLPVSTTHVATGGIAGLGLAHGGIAWRALARIGAAWLLTLPLAALVSALLLAWIR
jgi:PiT family inorganic phosphate transporter